MKYGVIDIGSNSVRLMLWSGIGQSEKFVETTQLGRGLALSGQLSQDAIERTANAVEMFVKKARTAGAEECYAFATEAVRSAKNGQEFVKNLADRDIVVQVLQGEQEALLGFAGAYTSGKCCVLDIGGASTEIVVGDAKKIDYVKSVSIGIVRVKDKCGEDKIAMREYFAQMLAQFGQIPQFDNLLAIGGGATSFVAIVHKLFPYSSKFVDGRILSREEVKNAVEMLRSKTLEERKFVVGLEEKRRDVIVGSGELLIAVMDMLGRNSVIARESDNMEGYLMQKLSQ